MELAGKIALVTGGAVRVGRAIALALAREGANMAVHYGRSEDAARAVKTEIEAMARAEEGGGKGRRAEVFQANLADPRQIERLLAAVGEAFGRLDVLVNCAAVYDRTPLETLTADQWDAEFTVNARAPALCIRHALPLMAGGGAIVNITDISAEKAWPGYPAYCASKAALVALTKSAAKALAPRGIRVNSVAPGVAAWPAGVTESDPHARKVLAQVPMGRAGTPEDIAAAVVFLAKSDYITGQNLRVDGGWCTA